MSSSAKELASIGPDGKANALKMAIPFPQHRAISFSAPSNSEFASGFLVWISIADAIVKFSILVLLGEKELLSCTTDRTPIFLVNSNLAV